ncbi:MAG TPA: PDZ domain-containing protein [Thermoanaerobaculia bacterium]
MTRMVTTLSLALFLGLSSLAAAGGENCDKSKAAHAKTAMHEKAKHGWLGLDVEKNASNAYVVTRVAAGSPAEEAGFQKGDVLVAFNGIALTDENKGALKKAKMQNAVGKQVTYTISRAGSERRIAATLAKVPAEVLAEWEKEYDRTVAVAQTDN